MKQWFLALTQRERYMVIATAGITLLFLMYQIIWSPLSNRYAQLQKNVITTTETIRWMKNAAKEVQQLSGDNAISTRPQGKQFVLGMIERTAKAAKLGSVMKRVQPEGQNGVRVWLENAAFDETTHWLDTLSQKHGLDVKEINVEKQEEAGRVNVRVLLEF